MELRIEQARPQRNALNGRFLKGHTAAMLKNLEKGRIKGNATMAGWNAKAVVAIKDNKLVGVFKSASEAAKQIGVFSTNISKVCKKKRKTAGGYRWFYEADNEWTKIVKDNNNERASAWIIKNGLLSLK